MLTDICRYVKEHAKLKDRVCLISSILAAVKRWKTHYIYSYVVSAEQYSYLIRLLLA